MADQRIGDTVQRDLVNEHLEMPNVEYKNWLTSAGQTRIKLIDAEWECNVPDARASIVAMRARDLRGRRIGR